MPTCRTDNCGRHFMNMSALRKHTWKAHRDRYNREANKDKVMPEQLTPTVKLDIPELPEHEQVAFSDSEHDVIKLSCQLMYNTLQGVLYKLQKMDAMEKMK
jgi:hypothetical protein